MPRIHASCVVLGECGVLIRGAPGSGKSSLARQLLVDAKLAGRFGRLVSDDMVEVDERHGRLLAHSVSPIEGRLEVRGLGIVGSSHERSAVVRLVIDCEGERPTRMPEKAEQFATILGVRLRRLVHHGDSALADVVARMCGPDDTLMTVL
jgi:HPr kinase/phosphorylase